MRKIIIDQLSEKCSEINSKNFLLLLFFIFKIKVYNNEITDDTTYELLYDTTNTVPGGAIYHDYPLALT